MSPAALASNDVDTGPFMPDSPFYGLELAMDRVDYALSQNREAKGLEIAKKRLAEAKAMEEENKEKQQVMAMEQAREYQRRAMEAGGETPDRAEVNERLAERARDAGLNNGIQFN